MNSRTRAWWLRAALCVSLAFAPTVSAQVPAKLGYQGRLLKADGTPEAGVVPVTFSIFSASTGGTALWSETQQLGLSDGYYATFLGSVTSFPAGLFDGTDRYLELTVAGAALTPRQQVGSVAYALMAGKAVDATNLSGGTVNASSISVNGAQVIDSSGKLAGTAAYVAGSGIAIDPASRTVSLKNCAVDELLKFDGTAWNCQPIAAGTEVDPTVKSFAKVAMPANCTAAQKLKWNGTAWTCAADNDTTYTAGSGLLLSVANELSLNSTGCASGDLLKWSSTTLSWACGADLNTSYSRSGPISLTGTTIGLTACAANQIYKMNAAGTAWACDVDDNTAYTRSGPISLTGTTFGLTACAANQTYKMNAAGTAWACAADDDTTYTRSGPISLTGTTFGLTACAANQVYKMNAAGTAWACAADNDTVLTVGTTAGTVAAGDDSRFGNATSIQGRAVAAAAPASGDVMAWSGTTWAPTTLPAPPAPNGRNLIAWGSLPTSWTANPASPAPTITANTATVLEGDASFDFSAPSVSTGGVTAVYGSDFIPVNPLQTYQGQIWVMATGVVGSTFTGDFYAGFVAYNRNKVALAGNGAAGAPVVGGVKCSTFIANGVPGTSLSTAGFTQLVARVSGQGTGLNQFPAGTRFIKPCVGTNLNGIGTTRLDAMEFFSVETQSAYSKVAIYRTAGTSTLTLPIGANRLWLKMWGGGAGGGGDYDNGVNITKGGGGGGGAYAEDIVTVNSGDTLSITVGAAGTAGALSAAGGAGGDSFVQVGGVDLARAGGGSGGQSGMTATGGAGGAATGAQAGFAGGTGGSGLSLTARAGGANPLAVPGSGGGGASATAGEPGLVWIYY